ncbi:MAG: hypothetical protein AB7F89_11740 [Pirellulaceae bacterium]
MQNAEAEEQNQAAETGEVAAGGSRPVASFSGSGGLNVAVWKQKSESGYDHYSVRLERSYKDESGNYKSTLYLREGDLLRAQKLLGQADDWIEQDRAKQRAAASGRGR